ncbi:MAG: serine/threonine-protein phosphatase, partial [Kiritimatiellae bacterium]|nr:serine/threonine-protein phosphatase [Kiritimatiellia bacterium]
LQQLSTDHSYEWATGVKGFSNVITNCVGAAGEVFLDMAPVPHFAAAADGSADTYLLCSDGLSDLVDDEQLARFLRAEATAPALVRMALQAGGRDNVSAVTVRVGL